MTAGPAVPRPTAPAAGEPVAGFVPRRSSMWRLLGNERRFGVFFAGAALSNIGTWCQTIAGILLIYRFTGSVLIVGFASVAQFTWPLLLGPWAGMVADRFDRRAVLIVTQSIAALVSGALAALTFSGLVNVPIALSAIAMLGILQAFQAPAQLALVPLLVAKEDLDLGLAANSSQFNLARVLGPVVASGLILIGGLGTAFLANAVSFVVFVVLLRLTKPMAQEMPKDSPRLRDTVAAAIGSPGMLPLFGIGFVVSGSADSVNTLGPAIAVELTGTDEWTAWFVAAFGLGALTSAAFLVVLLRRFRRRLPWTIAVQAVGAALFGFVPVPWVALAGAALFGAGFLLSANRALSVIQSRMPPDLTGRVTALWLMAFLGGRAVYAIVTGVLADAAGPRAAAAVIVTTIVLAAAGSFTLGARPASRA